jgi:hypothetical protein
MERRCHTVTCNPHAHLRPLPQSTAVSSHLTVALHLLASILAVLTISNMFLVYAYGGGVAAAEGPPSASAGCGVAPS